MGKMALWLLIIVGGVGGGLIPSFFGASFNSGWGIIGSFFGGLAGIYVYRRLDI